jgi:hypothetical protein
MSLSCPEFDRKKFVRRLGIDHRVFGIFSLTLKTNCFSAFPHSAKGLVPPLLVETKILENKKYF